MVLLGWVTLIYVSYTESRPGGYSTHSKTNWSVNGFWTGSYEHTCRWLPKLMEAVEAKPLPLFTTLLSIGFSVLAIAIKLRIMTELDSEPVSAAEVKPSSPPALPG